jgi:hypothetical protein
MNSTREETVNAILDKLFVNGMGQRADRMVLVQEDYPGKAKVSDARDLGGWSRLPIRDLLLDALRQREREVRVKERELCAVVADERAAFNRRLGQTFKIGDPMADLKHTRADEGDIIAKEIRDRRDA